MVCVSVVESVIKTEGINEQDPLSDTSKLMDQDPLRYVETILKKERTEEDELVIIKEEQEDENCDKKIDIVDNLITKTEQTD